MAIKSANVIARVDPDVKRKAEQIMSDLGLPVSVVINALYRQIIINEGIPFEIKKEPLNIDELTEDELYKILLERIESYEKEGGVPAEEVFERLNSRFNEDRNKLNSLHQKSRE